MDDRSLLFRLFDAALSAAQPDGKFEGRLPEPPRGRTIVLGAGKAAASMAAAFEDAWGRPCEGVVVTRYGHSRPTRHIEVVEAGHPVPDRAGLDAARRVLALAGGAGSDDLVVALISGGASSLLALPAPGISLEQKQALTRQLLASGAPIRQINAFRMGLSAIKGGRLARAAAPACLATYVISDVPGDDPALIGSGPTLPQPVDAQAVLAIARRYGLVIDDSLRSAILANGGAGGAGGPVHMLASPRRALDAAAACARACGLVPLDLGDRIEGEAREVAKVLGGIALSCRATARPVAAPAVILSGGETTVTLRGGGGKGGRNAEFLLALFEVLGDAGFAALAADTDGIDGVERNAGAWFDASTHMSAKSFGLSAGAHLANNDAFSFFERLGTLVETGPTRTNVNDFRAILVR